MLGRNGRIRLSAVPLTLASFEATRVTALTSTVEKIEEKLRRCRKVVLSVR
jgi:hypothetical protein